MNEYQQALMRIIELEDKNAELVDAAKEAIEEAGWMYVLATNELKETDDDYLYRFYLGVKMGMRLILTLVEPEKKDRESWRLLIETSHQYIYLSESILDALLTEEEN